jgi:hypothetical protein
MERQGISPTQVNTIKQKPTKLTTNNCYHPLHYMTLAVFEILHQAQPSNNWADITGLVQNSKRDTFKS